MPLGGVILRVNVIPSGQTTSCSDLGCSQLSHLDWALRLCRQHFTPVGRLPSLLPFPLVARSSKI